MRFIYRTTPIFLLTALLTACSGDSLPQVDGGDSSSLLDSHPPQDGSDGAIVDRGAVPDGGCASTVTPEAGLVVTKYGPVRAKDEGQVWAFLGVRFAAPPSGPLRFAPPQEPACWSETRAADAYPPTCPQIQFEQDAEEGTFLGQEDCLFLNVWTPKAPSTTPRAVMVYIHGGGNSQGATSKEGLGTKMFDGALMAERGDVVVVTIQYRVGPLGYLVLPELAAESPNGSVGNYGLRDQILALRWVKEHAARFGGDPSKVLLFGESAGALNTCMHLVSPLSAGLFSRALMQSGGCVAMPRAEREAEGVAFATEMGCDTAVNRPACLRSVSPEKLVSVLRNPLAGGLVKMAFGPVIDGELLPKAPMAILEAGEHNKVPFVVGSNSDEMALAIPPLAVGPAQVLALIAELPQGFRARALALYPAGQAREEARDSYIRALSDSQFTCLARRIARAARANQSEPVYRYFFTQPMPGPLGGAYGAFHGLELFYVFQGLEQSNIAAFMDAGDTALASRMLGYWTRLARNGDVNGNPDPAWPLYDAATDSALELAAISQTISGIRSEACDLWDEIAASAP